MSPTVRVEDDGAGIGRLHWGPEPLDRAGGESLQAALTRVADDLLGSGAFRRLETGVPASDGWARRAVLRSGFRQEGVRRRALLDGAGRATDQIVYARLTEDTVGGAVGFSAVMNTALPRKRLIAHVVFRDRAGRVLLCRTRFKTDWELPGGIVEPGEAPRVGAAREVREELGVDRAIGGLLAVDWMPPYLGWEDALELLFDGGLVEEDDLAGFTLQPEEIETVALRTLDDAAVDLTPLSLRRLRAVTALAPGATVLLEDGSPVTG